MNALTLTHLSRPPLVAGEGPSPLLLLLHGVGSNERDLMAFAPVLDPRFTVISARAPISMGREMFGWFNLEWDRSGQLRYEEAEARQSLKQLQQFLEEVTEAYNLDSRRRYVLGFSQGAILGQALLYTAPQTVAGLVAVSGRLPAEFMAAEPPGEGLTHKPLLVVHGLYDPVLPITNGRAIRDAFQQLGADVTYREYAVGHSINAAGAAAIAEWLTSQLNTAERG